MQSIFAAILAAIALGGCVSVPTAPAVFALPGRDKTLEQFTVDDVRCRQYAGERLGTVAPDTAFDMQRRYDTAYIQCMYAAGHRVPVAGIFTSPPPGAPPPPPGSPAPAPPPPSSPR